MSRITSSALVLLLLTTSLIPAITAANEPPLADAGLDQNVTRGATVLLDATGSHDPDGNVDRYEWSITGPDGRPLTPDCTTCPRTQFRPPTVGTYTVSLTVTDEFGATARDTLYVTVTPGEKPTVSVSGPRRPRVGEQVIYSATIDAGAASLDRVVWSLDGKKVATRSISGADSVDTFERTFPSAGKRSLTVTVYDSDGQTASDTLDVSVRSSPSPPLRGTLADRYAPTIAGDSLITGTSPLRGTYDLQSRADSSEIKEVRWIGDGRHLGGGSGLTTDWQPGDHSLYAVVAYADGSRDVARFADGSTTVAADPKPMVELSSLDTFDTISGRATAIDRYENLQSITVRLDGTVIGTAAIDPTISGDIQRRQESSFNRRDFEPGKAYTLTVIAVDTRGQRSTLTREITPAKKPKIIESRFVNGPVDSYHERIDPERYTAHHVMKIDLNGVDPSDLYINRREINSQHRVRLLESPAWSTNGGLLTISSNWVAEVPGEYSQVREIRIEQDNFERINITDESILNVTPSHPELRVEVTNDGTSGYRASNWGIVVDASDSFDPDGSKLKYIWQMGAEPITPDNKTGKFRSVNFAKLVLEDRYNLRSSKQFNYLKDFSPKIGNIKVLSEGPYKPNETIRLRVTTEKYRFTKETYHDQFNLGVSTDGVSSNVVSWRKQVVTSKGDTNYVGDPRRYSGIIEIEAAELAQATDDPKIRVFNEKDPSTYEERGIPTLEVYRLQGTLWTNVSITNTDYLVKRPIYDWKVTGSQKERDHYLAEGYSVDKKTRDGFEYILEERVKVRDAKYEKKTKKFSTELLRSAFLRSHSDWWSAGHENKERTWTTTEREWRDSRSGEGAFTGNTRRVKTEPAEYRTLKQYRYRYEVEKTGTRTVTRTREVEVTRTDTKYVTKCGRHDFCFEFPKTYAYTTTIEKTYTTTEQYTYTVTRYNTYWSYQKFSWDHWATGEKKRVKVEDAEYETQYQFEYREEHTEVIQKYKAQTREKVRAAKYEWRKEIVTKDDQVVQSLISDRDWRIGSHRPNVRWSLKKRTGTETTTVNMYLKENWVATTYVTAEVDVTKQYFTGDRTVNETIGTKIVNTSYRKLVSPSEIRSKLRKHLEYGGSNCENELRC
ncbi:PKD domain-containing protein [Haladaptatus salinisoli]|uniref:PKD domain-containing protein n=1 Tax=Haladaptatus salinisoli TaxID=2884876 RepID=UPI001D0B0BC9|nr:PKD domain-containing protein [Haladaptatus salinisoli]